MTSVTDNQIDHGGVEPSVLTKEATYNLIGSYNREIVKLEEEIPVLEDRLRTMPDDYQGDRDGVAMALHERRDRLNECTTKVRYLRGALIERFEHEIGLLDKMDHRELNASDWNKLKVLRADIEAELATLKKLVL